MAILPILIGMLSGVVATVWGFGQIHILTLVIGTSLVGVLIDFPLHWLAGSLLTENGCPFLRCKIAFYLFHQLVSYLTWVWTTCLYLSAYLAANRSFSAVSLITALLATQLFLPYLFYRYQPTTLLPERKHLI